MLLEISLYGAFIRFSWKSSINEFIKCIEYFNLSEQYNFYFECQVIKYENKNLKFLKSFDVFSGRYYIYKLKYSNFDENKMGFLFYDSNSNSEYDFSVFISMKIKFSLFIKIIGISQYHH